MITDSPPGPLKRFLQTMELFFEAITIQSRSRTTGVIPDLEDYIALRRDTSACKPCWVLIEYAGGLDLPDEVTEDPVVRSLEDAANDLVSWSNVRTSTKF